MLRTEKPDGVRGGAEEKSTGRRGENKQTGKGWRNSGKRCPFLG